MEKIWETRPSSRSLEGFVYLLQHLNLHKRLERMQIGVEPVPATNFGMLRAKQRAETQNSQKESLARRNLLSHDAYVCMQEVAACACWQIVGVQLARAQCGRQALLRDIVRQRRRGIMYGHRY